MYSVVEDAPGELDLQVPSPFTPKLSYANIGKSVMITILDVCEKNPYSRVFSSAFHSIENIRRMIGWECARLERFRFD